MNTCNQVSQKATALLMVGATLVVMSALAADMTGVADVQERYQRDRTACMSAQSNRDRMSCLREAGAAFADVNRNGLDGGLTPSVRHALLRCERLPDEDRRACWARMQGQGTTSGSAADGGIHRELGVRDPIPPNTVGTPP